MIKGCFLLKMLFLPATTTHRRLPTAKQTVSLIVLSILLVVSVESQSTQCFVCVPVWLVYLEACEAVVEWCERVDIRLPA